MRLASTALLLVAAGLYGQGTLTVAFLSDHGVCSPAGLYGQGHTSQCNEELAVAGMVHGWNPDWILAGGDMSNWRGSRADTYKGIYVRLLNAVTTPGSQQVAIDPAQLNGDLNIFGSGGVSGGPYLVDAGTVLGVDEGTSQWEVVSVTEAIDATHFTASFTKPHAAGALVRGSQHTPYLDDISRHKFLPLMGNHDYGGGNDDWCGNLNPPCMGPASAHNATMEYEGFNYYFAGGKPYYTKVIGGLVTFFMIDSEGYVDGVTMGSAQQQKFTADMIACATPWCVSVLHRHTRSSYPFDADSDLFQWVAGPNVDLVLNGHMHVYERVEAPNSAGDRMIPYITAGTGGDFGEGLAGTPCSPPCSQKANVAAHGAVKLTITATKLTAEFLDKTGVLRDSMRLSRASATMTGSATLRGAVRTR